MNQARMHPLTRSFFLTSLVLAVAVACQSGDPAAKRYADEAADKKAAEEQAAEKKAEEQAKRRAEARRLEEERRERAYQEAKGKLEPWAKLPKKRPKGFGAACDAMLKEYDAFMQKTLEGDALAKWKSQAKEHRFPVLRRACHKRAVEVVVCETQVLKKAPAEVEIDHIMRVCQEKFSN